MRGVAQRSQRGVEEHKQQPNENRRLLRPKSERSGSAFQDQSWPATTPCCDVLASFPRKLRLVAASSQPLTCRAARALPTVPLAQRVIKSGSSYVWGCWGKGTARWRAVQMNLARQAESCQCVETFWKIRRFSHYILVQERLGRSNLSMWLPVEQEVQYSSQP